MVTDIIRRNLISSTIGMSLMGTLGVSAAEPNSGGSPSNPRLLYNFNAKGLATPRPTVAMSFSRSGQYLAVLSEGSITGGPEFVVWDVKKRKAALRTSDTSIVPDSSIEIAIEWGPLDSWIAFTTSDKGRLTLFDPKNGSVIRKLLLNGHEYKFSPDGRRVLYTKFNKDSPLPKIVITDLMDESQKLIPMTVCASSVQTAPQILQWIDHENILLLGGGYVGSGEYCTDDEVVDSKISRDANIDSYYASIIDLTGHSSRRFKRFSGRRPWYRHSINLSDDKKFAIIDNRFKFDLLELSFIPLDGYQNSPPGDDAKFAAGHIAYCVNSGSLFNSSYILDVSANNIIGRLPLSNIRSSVCVSSDRSMLSVSLDGQINLYQI